MNQFPNNNQNFNDLNLNDPLVQKIIAYLRNQMNMNNMNNMYFMNNMNNMNNMNFMNNMNMGQMNQIQMQNIMNYMNNMNNINNMNNMNNMNNNMNNMNNMNNNMNNMNNMNNNMNFNNNQNNNQNYNQNNNQNNNQNISDSIREMNRKKQKKLKELLPREDKMEYERSIKGNNEKLMNIAINATSGYKVMITASVDTTIEELLKIYVHKIKLPERVINNEIVFLFDGQKLDHTSQQEIGTAFKNTAIIIVVDIGEIIGA